MNRYDLSEFLLSLMNKANTHTPLHFQQYMIGLMRGITVFDSAWWGWSVFRGGKIAMVHTMVSGLPEGFEPKVKAHLVNDPFVRTGRSLKRYARSLSVEDAVTDPGFKVFAEEFDLTQMLNGHCKVREGPFNFFMSLYRHGQNPAFTDTETTDFLAILRHLEQALSMCLQLDLGLRVDPCNEWALLDHEGELFLCSSGFNSVVKDGLDPEQKPTAMLREFAGQAVATAPSGTTFSRVRYSDDLWLVSAQPVSPLNRLSPKERRVAELLIAGATMRVIAEESGVSVNTVRNQVASVYRKTGVHNKVELLRLAGGLPR
ncbi:Response regulator [Phaeobacter inhibens]|uniref:helix-turn-helix transcriptional regulator n=1 Tax=Phaeobacter inhibens TaxID=221822 RepID=UPI000C9B5235|nr:helix-turn-helix transcriptional regulator [Phaeobacter inhibens]AUQ58658.1 Response regulator [Phaeobacter inhibens]